jgi:hypothetical protein
MEARAAPNGIKTVASTCTSGWEGSRERPTITTSAIASPRLYAPARVLGRHAYDQRGDIRLGARATGVARLRAVVLLGDEFPIPTEDGVRGHDPSDVREAAPAEDLALHG